MKLNKKHIQNIEYFTFEELSSEYGTKTVNTFLNDIVKKSEKVLTLENLTTLINLFKEFTFVVYKKYPYTDTFTKILKTETSIKIESFAESFIIELIE